MNYYTRPVFCVLFLAIAIINGRADNGAIAYAYPIAHKSIDGELSDWPKDHPKYPITIAHSRGVKPTSESDFQASFMVGYNLANSSIYLAVQVIDESYMVDRSINPKWDQQDRHLLYLDPKHSKDGSCPISYAASQIRREIGGSDFGWDPQTEHASWGNVELEISRKGNVTVYEYRIEWEGLQANSTIGLDHVIYDKDANDQGKERSYMMWGPHAGKSGATGRCGDLVLLAENTALVEVNGSVEWENELQDAHPSLLRISAQNQDNFWLTVALNEDGSFRTQVPKGDYDLSSAVSFWEEEEQEFRIDNTKRKSFHVEDKAKKLSPWSLGILPKPMLLQKEGVLLHFNPTDTLKVDQFMQRMMEYYCIPGASLGVITDGILSYHKTYGVKNALTKKEVQANTIFQAASITKPVFAYAVLRLAEKGVIDLDKPLHEYLAFEDLEEDERYKKMTARHVLSHQTGLPNWGRRLQFEPGTSYGYSGEGFEYLKRVVEHISQKNILDILMEEVQLPLGLTENTYFVREDEMYPKAALGHHYDLPTTNWIINRVGMARSMYTEANEFSKFILALMEGKGLHKDTYADMLRPQVKVPLNENNPVADWPRSFGLGVQLKDTPYGKSFSHGGSNRYFQSLFEVYSDKKIGFVVFTNNDMGYHLGNDLREFLIIGE